MSQLRDLKTQVLVDGVVDDEEVEFIRQHLGRDDYVSLENFRFLVDLYCEADQTCPAFRRLLFDSMRAHILEDGEVFLSEQFYILKALYADGIIDEDEKAFLRELQANVETETPEFRAMCEQVLAE